MKNSIKLSGILLTALLFSGCNIDENRELSYNDIELSKQMYNYSKLQYELVNKIKSTTYDNQYDFKLDNTLDDMEEIRDKLYVNNKIVYPETFLDFGIYDWDYMTEFNGHFNEYYQEYIFDFEEWFNDINYSYVEAFEVGCKISSITYVKANNNLFITDSASLSGIFSNIKYNSLSLYTKFDENLKFLGFNDGCCSISDIYCISQ